MTLIREEIREFVKIYSPLNKKSCRFGDNLIVEL